MDKNELLEQLKKTPYISKQNLGLLLEKQGENLNYWVKKLIADKTLVPLKKGLYIPRHYYDIMNAADPREKEKYVVYLANTIRQPSYLSLEYVLSKNGLIPEAPFAITSITLKSTRSYTTDIGTFYYKSIKKELFYGYSPAPFRDKLIQEASIAKALFDFLYIKPFKNQGEMENYLCTTGRLNWDVFEERERLELFEVINKSQSQKMLKILALIKKNKL